METENLDNTLMNSKGLLLDRVTENKLTPEQLNDILQINLDILINDDWVEDGVLIRVKHIHKVWLIQIDNELYASEILSFYPKLQRSTYFRMFGESFYKLNHNIPQDYFMMAVYDADKSTPLFEYNEEASCFEEDEDEE